MPHSASETQLGFVSPELPTLVSEPPIGEGWIYEIKYDGYRTVIAIDRGHVRDFTRNGNDWTRAYRPVVDVFDSLPRRHVLCSKLPQSLPAATCLECHRPRTQTAVNATVHAGAIDGCPAIQLGSKPKRTGPNDAANGL